MFPDFMARIFFSLRKDLKGLLMPHRGHSTYPPLFGQRIDRGFGQPNPCGCLFHYSHKIFSVCWSEIACPYWCLPFAAVSNEAMRKPK